MKITKMVRARPESELGQRPEAVQIGGEPVLVDTGEDVNMLLVSQTDAGSRADFTHYDPQAAISGVQALQRAFKGVDREQLLTDLTEQREQDSGGRPA